MRWRRQLAVASPISIAAVARAIAKSATSRDAISENARRLLADRYGAQSVVLTDSGTSALVLALRAAVRPGGTVGFPGYACVDLAAAALFAGVRVRLYDIDPVSLSPDLASVEALIRRGVDAIVVAHLFGYPADVPAVRELAGREGIPVIEDAAQGAGGSLRGKRLGSLGDLSILSFGRGKGLCAAGGGALMAFAETWARKLDDVRLPAPGSGLSRLAVTGVQWVLGRPLLYALPSMLPWLHLGEMVYHPAHEPVALPAGSGALLPSALDLDTTALADRRRRAQALESAARHAPELATMTPVPGADPGFLRFPIRDLGGGRQANEALGVLRSYPATLAEQAELSPVLMPSEPTIPGATTLRRELFTLPTHQFVTGADLVALADWLREPGSTGESSARLQRGPNAA
jgi:perosamine synthetase